MMDLRAMIALVLGVAGLTVGAVAVVADLSALAAVAGLFALVSGILAAVLSRASLDADRRCTEAEDQISDLEAAVAAQLKARMEAEQAVHNLGEQLARSERTSPADPRRSETPPGAAGLTDAVTGLFSQEYFQVSLDSRIASARRHLRPVAVALLDVVEGLSEGRSEPANPMAVASGINKTLRDSDTACRLRDGRFALLLEDTPENGAIWTIERIRRALSDQYSGITVWAGIACYPAHAFDSGELVTRADTALESAREWRQDRIEIATSD